MSVVVPVYNPGHQLDRCVDSLLRQSMPSRDFEVIFVDDGSTDDSPSRLDALAADHPHVRVIHQENSGWPGKPRNVGIDASRGEFVFFMDHDDRLGPEAVERMYDMAARNQSDVVVVKIVGAGRRAPQAVFRINREHVTFTSTPMLVHTLTPQKLFRKAFLDQHGLRFPEGRRRLEDHHFVIRSYFAASVISVLGDYPCYYHHSVPGGTAAGGRFDPAGSFDPAFYYPYLREVLEIVEAHTEPGSFRDELLKRWTEGELLGRLGSRKFKRRLLRSGEDARHELVEEVRGVIRDLIPTTVDALLAPLGRTQMSVLRSDRPDRTDLLSQLARFDSEMSVTALVAKVAGRPGGGLQIVVTTEITVAAAPLVFEEEAGRLLLPVPPAVAAVVPTHCRILEDPSEHRGVADAAAPHPRAALAVLRLDDVTDVVLRTRFEDRLLPVEGGARLQRTLRFRVDPDDLASGSGFVPGRWRVRVRPWIAGLYSDVPVARPPQGAVPGVPGVAGGRLTSGWDGPEDHLVIDAGAAPRASAIRQLRRRARALVGALSRRS